MLGEKKIIRGINTLGRKTKNTVAKIGQKTHGVLNKIDTGINKADNFVDKAIDRTANVAQKVIDKSGKVTDVLRVGSNIANAVSTNLASVGVPGAGLAMGATKALAKGAEQLDKKRDNIANRIEDARQRAQLEKSNLRKRIDEQKQNLDSQVSKFV